MKKNCSLRLTFTYHGTDIKLQSLQHVNMKPFPSESIQKMEMRKGSWYEIKDSKDHTLYRRIIPDPVSLAMEVKSDDPDAPIKWEEIKNTEGLFVIVVPEIEKAANIVLFGRPADTGKEQETGEIGRFDLTESVE